MSRLTRDGTAKPVSRDQISGANTDREMFIFPVKLTTSRFGNLSRLIHTLAICVTIQGSTAFFQHAHFIPIIVGVGKERRILIGP